MSRPSQRFIAVDGEAIGNQYVLLCSSDGEVRRRTERGGLTTIECLEYLLRRPPGVLVCFGLGYDVNNWLRDLPREALARLWDERVCYWHCYRIEWTPQRWLTVRHADGRKARVNECFGFFQSSFVAALEAWGIGAPAMIERMKRARGTFEQADLPAMERYCLAECGLLVELMEQLRDACWECGIMPRQWIGAGAIAGSLLQARGIGAHHAHDLALLPGAPETAENVTLSAYFGGRFELLRQGVYANVKSVDLRSAYPAAATRLPSLDGARLIHRKRFDPSKFGIWRVGWDISAAPGLIAPFPARRKQGIYWPAVGRGWYHGVEVAAAIAAGYPVDVTEGWVLRESGGRPFGWINDVYAERRRLKDEGRAAEKVVKLGLNSIYGKLAQGISYRGRPQWQSYFWAGYITAATRARVLDMGTRSDQVLMFATDGIFARVPGAVGAGHGLGSWETGRIEQLFTAQAGVYQGITPAGAKVKSRGFFASEVDYDELREGWECEGPSYIHHYDSTRFIGLGVALMRKDFTLWRSWRTERRALILAPERKGIDAAGVLTPHPGPIDSEPYTPKVSLIDARALDQLQGADQPLREVM